MIWAVFALIATFLWACTNIIDKILRIKFLKDSTALTAAFGIYSILFSFALLIFVGVPSLPFSNFIAAFIAGVMLAPIVILYLKALSIEEASRVVPLWHFSPLFTLVLAVIFLKEILAPVKYIAFASILLGGILITTRHVGNVFRTSPAVIFMLISSFLVAVEEVLLKFAYSSGNFWETFLVFYFGVSIGSLSLFALKSARKKFSRATLTYNKILLATLFLSVLTGFLGQLSYNYAILSGPITLISVFVSFQSLFVLLIATFLSLKFPLFLQEAIDIKTIGVKIVAIVLMAFGMVLLSL